MSNVIGFNEFAPVGNGGPHCWLCQKAVSMRALFCHHCGTIQPVRDIDHFARLGLERRIDVDIEHLEQQYAALSRTLDPQRFMIRGIGERGHAAKQMEVLDAAYETLRDTLSRSRYWLALHEKEFKQAVDVNPVVASLRHELDSAADTSQCDRVAQRAGQAMEQGIMGLMQALRGQNWQQANTTLVELDGLEVILGDVRTRRAELTPPQR
ncbi:MAG: molecular chaperone DnaJ [Alphaproteobacteria bacterium]|nr:molecular chaperone DnaJ [Alphaproteobacteria bacterium]